MISLSALLDVTMMALFQDNISHSSLQLPADTITLCVNTQGLHVTAYKFETNVWLMYRTRAVLAASGGVLAFSSCCQGEEKGTSFHTEKSQGASVKEAFTGIFRDMCTCILESFQSIGTNILVNIKNFDNFIGYIS